MTDTKHSLEQVLEAIEKGITRTGTAKVLGCTPETVYNYAKRWKTVNDALHSKRRELVDLAEMGLRGAVLAREPWAVTFTLRTLGKDEGYTERHEVTGKDGEPITFIEVARQKAESSE
jgi:predicted transcriptional regulator